MEYTEAVIRRFPQWCNLALAPRFYVAVKYVKSPNIWVYEKLLKVLKIDCSTCQKLFSMDEYDSFKLHTSKCVISAFPAKEAKLTDIFKINKQDQLTRDMEDPS